MSKRTNNNTPLNYVIQGEGQPVILIHGIAASRYDWQFLLPELASNGFQAYALDLLGHGDSPKPNNLEAYHFDSLAQHFEEWVTSLGLEQPAVLLGHSLGGLLSLHYAIDHPDNIKALILVDPFYDSRQLTPILRAVNHKPALAEKAMRMIPPWLFNKVMNWDLKPMNEYSEQIRRQIAEDYKRVSPHIVHITNTVPDLNADLEKIEHTTLVMWGDNDLTLDPRSFPDLVERIPNASGQIVPNCGHQPHLAKPDEFNKIVLDFIINNSQTKRVTS